MTTVATRVRRISDLEGFDIVVTRDGHAVDVSENGLMPDYPYRKACRATHSVSDWKQSRFERNYPGLSCNVLKEDGTVANGNTRLSNVRQSYEED
ncbi:hypothetical protein ACERZ8_09135 [Tateyamaria armeniaca]|uniref:Uncharacterized protein n=1 Tax=Tateyamaria armeniaca TaxID=2518930 RepID=A0ABW8UWH8_9RHOB